MNIKKNKLLLLSLIMLTKLAVVFGSAAGARFLINACLKLLSFQTTFAKQEKTQMSLKLNFIRYENLVGQQQTI
jgi:hypothetical protein